MKRQPSLKKINQLVSQVGEGLNHGGIKYLVYGSLVYQKYTGNDAIFINDIDIIISKKDFSVVEELLASTSQFKLFVYENTVHANHKSLVGNDDKPFDVSFDSFEYYFQKHGLSLGVYKLFPIKGIPVKFITRDNLLKIYEFSIENSPQGKRDEYIRKVENLKAL
jgi:hypothetical protein